MMNEYRDLYEQIQCVIEEHKITDWSSFMELLHIKWRWHGDEPFEKLMQIVQIKLDDSCTCSSECDKDDHDDRLCRCYRHNRN